MDIQWSTNKWHTKVVVRFWNTQYKSLYTLNNKNLYVIMIFISHLCLRMFFFLFYGDCNRAATCCQYTISLQWIKQFYGLLSVRMDWFQVETSSIYLRL